EPAAGSVADPLEEEIPEEEALAALEAAAASAQAEAPEPTARATTTTRKARTRRASAKQSGTLSLSVSGWADVSVDGKAMGRFPQVRRFQLTEGTHVLELHNPHRQPYRAKVHVTAGQEVAHRAELVPIP